MTKGTFRIFTDNMWRRKATNHYLPIIGIYLNRETAPVFTKMTKKYLYGTGGTKYRLSFTLIGFAVEFYWHGSNDMKIRYKL